MSKILRALLISAAATGLAALLVNTLQQPGPVPPPPALPTGPTEIDADRLDPAEKDVLLEELATQL